MEPNDQSIEVWGELACFSRPEMKVERFSYPVITPSAARGIYDAIYCKPSRDGRTSEFRWQITRIEVLAPPAYISLKRNEVKDKASVRTKWLTGEEAPQPLWADGTRDLLGTDEKGRTQRQTMALKNVKYRLHAEIRPFNGYEHMLKAMEAQFRRRAASGKCIYQPYFGCREFPAYFELVNSDAPPPETLPLDMDLGLMLYDVFDLTRPGTSNGAASISLFHAWIKNGVLEVPEYSSEQVLKVPAGRR